MTAMRTITVNLPMDLLDSVVDLSGKGVTEALREALSEYRTRLVAKQLAEPRGEADGGPTWPELRGDDEAEDDESPKWWSKL